MSIGILLRFKIRCFSLLFIIECAHTVSAGRIETDFSSVYWNQTYVLNDTYSYKGQTRMYHVLEASNPSSTSIPPVLIALHGGGGNATGFAHDTQLGTYAQSFNVVFGEGFSNDNTSPSGERTWNAGSCCGVCSDASPYGCAVDDVSYVEGILDDLQKRGVSVNMSRIFVTGHSNGGFMAYRLACALQKKNIFLRGIAPVESSWGFINANECLVGCSRDEYVNEAHLCYNATSTNCSTTQVAWSKDLPRYFDDCQSLTNGLTSILAIQGLMDDHVYALGGACNNSNKCLSSAPFSVVPFDSAMALAAQLNQCDDADASPSKITFQNVTKDNVNDNTTCMEYSNCLFNTTVCKATENGHAWPGGQPPIYCDPTQPEYDLSTCIYLKADIAPQTSSIVASQIIVEFFQSLL